MYFVKYFICVSVVATFPKKITKEAFSLEKGSYIFQDDMLFSETQLEAALRGGDFETPKDSEYKEGVQSGKSTVGAFVLKWENGIVPYQIDSNAKCNGILCITQLGRPEKAIKSAIKEIHEKTCIRFKERTNEKDYIQFTNIGWSKCLSYVGRIGGKQELSLTNGCSSHGIALHEILHALGVHHEQSRSDRDNYIEIKTENIEPGKEGNFQKYPFTMIKTFDSPYDYDSIMHYDEHAFGKNLWSKTIVTRNGAQIGQRNRLSKYDALTLNKVYNCVEHLKN
ncbi:astacin-like metalloprotease toxin 5 [Hydra vulgaris]|uniref:Metalloendopeptidase n=1 Tax=Hydra vulgaris TaxID=6087 RepID=A0ABM4CWV2_HYDVU